MTDQRFAAGKMDFQKIEPCLHRSRETIISSKDRIPRPVVSHAFKGRQ